MGTTFYGDYILWRLHFKGTTFYGDYIFGDYILWGLNFMETTFLVRIVEVLPFCEGSARPVFVPRG